MYMYIMYWTRSPCNGSEQISVLDQCFDPSQPAWHHHLQQNQICWPLFISTGVLHTSVVLLTEMCERSPDMLSHFRKVCTHTGSRADLGGDSPFVLNSHHTSFSVRTHGFSAAKVNHLIFSPRVWACSPYLRCAPHLSQLLSLDLLPLGLPPALSLSWYCSSPLLL